MEANARPWKRLCFLVLLGSLASGCGIPARDIDSPVNRAAMKDAATLALTKFDCNGAIESIRNLYESEYSDNSIRLLMASAYACKSNINFIQLMNSIIDNTDLLGSAELWSLFTKLFPSTTDDRIVEGSGAASDALMSMILPGTILSSSIGFNLTTSNPASFLSGDREFISNFYLFFVSMAGIGGLQSRFGSPDASFHKTVLLPWTSATAVNADGCAYASSIVNFVDSVGAVAQYFSGSLGQSLGNIKTAFDTVVYTACNVGCLGVTPGGGWVASGCTVTTPCESCPLSLRNRLSCTGANDDQASCAAAGIVNFINVSPVGWTGP